MARNGNEACTHALDDPRFISNPAKWVFYSHLSRIDLVGIYGVTHASIGTKNVKLRMSVSGFITLLEHARKRFPDLANVATVVVEPTRLVL